MSTIINNLKPLMLDEVTTYAKPTTPPEPPGGTIGGWDPKHPAQVDVEPQVQVASDETPPPET